MVNWPVTKTRLPTITWSQTTPLICTVGSAAADTVSGSDGSGGIVSAAAGAIPTVAAMNAKFAATSTTATNAAANLMIDVAAPKCPALRNFPVTMPPSCRPGARQRHIPYGA